jgi:DNA-binding Lrp family transcriptional regulator
MVSAQKVGNLGTCIRCAGHERDCSAGYCQTEAQLLGKKWVIGSKMPASNSTLKLMDDTDRELIGLLRDNARLSTVALAAKLRVARATVQNRIARLEREGTITGYTVRLKPAAEAARIRALMSVAVEGNRAMEVMTALRGHPNVQALHSTNGRWDIVAELRADTLEAFDAVLRTIRQIDGIATTETSILLSTYK